MGVVIKKANKKERTIFSWGDSFEIPENYLNIADESTRGTQRNFVKNYNDGSENVSEIGSYDKEISGLYDLSEILVNGFMIIIQ